MSELALFILFVAGAVTIFVSGALFGLVIYHKAISLASRVYAEAKSKISGIAAEVEKKL